MVDPIAFRQFVPLHRIKQGEPALHQLQKSLLETSQEPFIVAAGKQLQHVVVVFLNMPKQMQEHRVGSIARKNVIVPAPLFRRVKNVAE